MEALVPGWVRGPAILASVDSRALRLGVAILLVASLSSALAGTAAVSPSAGYVSVRAPFGTEAGPRVFQVPPGSTIYQRENGVTAVHGPDKRVLFLARDAEAATLLTPNGEVKATHLFEVPSGALVETTGNTTKVFNGPERLLTVVDQTRESPSAVSRPSAGWLEYAYNYYVQDLRYFHARWPRPSSPPSAGKYTVNFAFTAIEPRDFSGIIQPVLEYNYYYDHKWTGSAWTGKNGNYFRAPQINVNAGDILWGKMSWNGAWNVEVYNSDTGDSSKLLTNNVGTTDLLTFCALEIYDALGDNDVCGDVTFTNVTFRDSTYRSVPLDWTTFVMPGTGLSGLGVDIPSEDVVRLRTVN